jgi:hypothetical protein
MPRLRNLGEILNLLMFIKSVVVLKLFIISQKNEYKILYDCVKISVIRLTYRIIFIYYEFQVKSNNFFLEMNKNELKRLKINL